MFVYAEEVFLINFVIDALMLGTVFVSLKEKIAPLRLFAAAFIGGVYAVFAIAYPLFGSTVFKLIVSGAMVFMLCGEPSLKRVVFRSVIFFTDSAFFAGFLLLITINKDFERSFSLKDSLIAVKTDYAQLLFCLLFTQLIFAFTVRKLLPFMGGEKLYVKGTIETEDGRSENIKCFLDTGNKLTSVTGIPVMLVDADLFERLSGLKYEQKDSYEELSETYAKKITEGETSGFCVIKVVTPLGEKYILSVRIKSVKFDGFNTLKDICMAGCRLETKEDGWQGIINPKILKR